MNEPKMNLLVMLRRQNQSVEEDQHDDRPVERLRFHSLPARSTHASIHL